MDRILLRDVRCFRGEHNIPFTPLTFLVGENSTGKSTILAMTRIAWGLGNSGEEADFNEEPFLLGSFDEIAHVPTDTVQREETFAVGFSVVGKLHSSGGPEVRWQGVLKSRDGQPVWRSIQAQSGSWAVKAENGELSFSFPDRSLNFVTGFEPPATVGYLITRFRDALLLNISTQEPLADAFRELVLVLGLSERMSTRSAIQRVGPIHRPLAIAPVRTRPKRTYDPLKESRSPEGDHVPMLLARLRATAPAAWEALAADLAEYGRGAGLFSELLVRRFDGGESSPFQVQVRLAGQKREVNLVDVGYGVSQVLPILVDAFTQPDESSFLLQQPEVHLHPRAQAELGTILASLVRRKHHKFMIETHSDHLVDRVRLEVRRGKLPAESVRIVYCERADSQVLTHEIKLDSNGNLIGAPEGYRQFFLNEELALVGG